MQRIPEPEVMDDPVQAEAYAAADFEAAHSRIVDEVRNDEGMKTGELICMECLAKFPDPACPPNRRKA